ncbi:Lipase_3 domain-containing protein [Caenorhabditis elegans]|uniref:Lipase_3 domain-containing protein n=1 Tax=Caenorhabditis elegans TaxID=6239 RepID=Q23196_CAEEL|nr:Lipase_3 domain-containing protein [Caenorhabditis elegans]CCD73639.2 Lipase_3 domain-containing protein [Caenorhabditis elegans]|eukprot:NP_494790.2 Uncharacterized protein CELE_W06B4.1 [Caenorhabditis elegans]
MTKNGKGNRKSTTIHVIKPPMQIPARVDPPKPLKDFYCGVEGNLACTRIVVIDSANTRYWRTVVGTDLHYFKPRVASETIASGVEAAMRKATGKDNWREKGVIRRVVVLFAQTDRGDKVDDLVTFFRNKYVSVAPEKRICEDFHVMSEIDAVAPAHFQKGEEGIALQAGVDAFCRLVLKDGTMKKPDITPGMIGHGGAYWCGRTSFQMFVNDVERGTENMMSRGNKSSVTDKIKDVFKTVFSMKNDRDLLQMNEICFSNYYKHRLALFTEKLARHNMIGDVDTTKQEEGEEEEQNEQVEEYEQLPVIAEVFHNAGITLGNLVVNVLRQYPPTEKEKTLKILLFGRMFDSYKNLMSGFLDSISDTGFERVELYRKKEVSAVTAAIHAASLDNIELGMNEMEFIDRVAFC